VPYRYLIEYQLIIFCLRVIDIELSSSMLFIPKAAK
jgi:hypothetical protein